VCAMKIIGLTGGIACGKSSVARILRDTYHLPIVDADELSHEVISPGSATYHQVVAAFSRKDILAESPAESGSADRPIDRKKLGAIVFNDEEARRKLNGIMSPAIGWAMAKAIIAHYGRGTAFLVLDVPLLYETGMDRVCDEVLVVTVPPELQLARLMARDDAGEADARARIASQRMTAEDKAKRSTFVITNDGDAAALEKAVAALEPSLRAQTLLNRLTAWPVLAAFFVVSAAAAAAIVARHARPQELLGEL